jgi:putative transposase
LRIKPRKRLIREKPEDLTVPLAINQEYISAAIQTWTAEWEIKLEYIQPGNPQQNAYVERFNRTVRYEWLSKYYWSSLEEVQEFATQWMWSFNNDRPNMDLCGFTPKQKLAKAL